MTNPNELTVRQGAQPSFAGFRVGVMRIGLRDGQPAVQLAVRSDRHSEIVVLGVGEVIGLGEGGRLRVREILAGRESMRSSVTFSFEPNETAGVGDLNQED